MSLPSGVRYGAQRPRIELRPAGIVDFSLGEDAAWLMEQAGKPLLPWQEYVISLILARRDGGRFAAFETALNIPRQNGKNVVVEARELYGLFLDPECKRITHSAHEYRTAKNAFGFMQDLVRGTPMLWSRVLGARGKPSDADVRGIKNSAAELSITLVDGSTLLYQTRSKDGGRGLTGDVVILDEAYDLTSDEVAAMMPTMAARSEQGSPQIIYTSSAGMLSSAVWESVRERGLAGKDKRLLYLEWSADDEVESDDLDAIYQANPSLGFLISEEYVCESELHGMSDEQFRRERLGIWARVGDDAAISRRDWRQLVDEVSQPSDSVVFAVDVPPSRDYAEIVVASPRADGRIHVEVVDRQVGTDWVAARLKGLQDEWAPKAIVVEAGGAAGALVSEFRRHGVRVVLVTGREYFQACGRFYDLVRQRGVVHRGQVELDEAVSGATMKFVGDSLFKWVRREPVSNISPLVAASLAVAGVERKALKKGLAKGAGWKVVAL